MVLCMIISLKNGAKQTFVFLLFSSHNNDQQLSDDRSWSSKRLMLITVLFIYLFTSSKQLLSIDFMAHNSVRNKSWEGYFYLNTPLLSEINTNTFPNIRRLYKREIIQTSIRFNYNRRRKAIRTSGSYALQLGQNWMSVTKDAFNFLLLRNEYVSLVVSAMIMYTMNNFNKDSVQVFWVIALKTHLIVRRCILRW